MRFSHGSLIIRGKVRVEDGFRRCKRGVPVKAQRKTARGWVRKGRSVTKTDGSYRFEIRDREGLYRVVAKRVIRKNQICARTVVKKKHEHSNR
jgi:hypothetical protein